MLLVQGQVAFHDSDPSLHEASAEFSSVYRGSPDPASARTFGGLARYVHFEHSAAPCTCAGRSSCAIGGPCQPQSFRGQMNPLFSALLIVGLTLNATGASAQPRPRAAAAAELSLALETTTALAAPAVVQIFTTSYTPTGGLVPRTADLVKTERASGSGVIVDSEGYIVTNAHVVRGARRLRVEIPVAIAGQSILARDSRTVDGQVVGIDVETDLAVVRVGE